MEGKTSNIDISVIIVNYKSWKHLGPCLKALTSFSSPDFSYEIIVVDNCSEDGKLEEFKNEFSHVNFILNSGNNGFANGCNTGAKAAKGDYLLFLNPDTKANQDALSKMLQFAKENSNVGIVSCLQKNTNGSYEKTQRHFLNGMTLFGFTRAIYKTFSKGLKEDEQLFYTDWVSGSVVLISKDWYHKVDGWNEDYWMYFEDVDLSKKVKNLEGQIALLKTATITHNHGGASRINFKTASLTKTEVIISKHVYIRNHFRGLQRFLLLQCLIIGIFISKLLMVILGTILFFIPKMKLQLYIAVRVFGYYVSSMRHNTWLSPRSMNYKIN